MTGFEPLIGAATAGLAGLIGNIIKEKGSDLLKEADIDSGRGQAFHQAIQKYMRHYPSARTLKVAYVRMDSLPKINVSICPDNSDVLRISNTLRPSLAIQHIPINV